MNTSCSKGELCQRMTCTMQVFMALRAKAYTGAIYVR